MWTLLYAALVFQVARCTDMNLFVTKAHDPGETVILSCPRSVNFTELPTFHWIRVLSGNFPEFLGGTFSFKFKGFNKTPRTTTKQGDGTFDLILHESSLNDTGFYYCVKVEKAKMELVFGVFLKIKGSASNVRVESPDVSGPVDSGDSVDLQCWVQMENAQCFEEHMVWWFRSGLDQPGPGLVYTQGNSSAQCDRSKEDPGPHKCLYTLSKTMSPSDTGTYRCAVAACGHILFGNGTKVTLTENCWNSRTANITLLLLSAVLGLIVIITPICLTMKKLKKTNQGHDQQELQVGVKKSECEAALHRAIEASETEWVYTYVTFVHVK